MAAGCRVGWPLVPWPLLSSRDADTSWGRLNRYRNPAADGSTTRVVRVGAREAEQGSDDITSLRLPWRTTATLPEDPALPHRRGARNHVPALHAFYTKHICLPTRTFSEAFPFSFLPLMNGCLRAGRRVPRHMDGCHWLGSAQTARKGAPFCGIRLNRAARGSAERDGENS